MVRTKCSSVIYLNNNSRNKFHTASMYFWRWVALALIRLACWKSDTVDWSHVNYCWNLSAIQITTKTGQEQSTVCSHTNLLCRINTDSLEAYFLFLLMTYRACWAKSRGRTNQYWGWATISTINPQVAAAYISLHCTSREIKSPCWIASQQQQDHSPVQRPTIFPHEWRQAPGSTPTGKR